MLANHHAIRKTPMEFTLMSLRLAGGMIYAFLLHGCDNMINRLAKRAKVLA
jgi:hypothetical protein